MIESQDSHPSICPPKKITLQDHTYAFSSSPNKVNEQFKEKSKRKIKS